MLLRSNLPSIDQPPAPGSLTQNHPGAQPRARPPRPQRPGRFSDNCQDGEGKAGHTWKEVGMQTRFRFSCLTLSAVKTKARWVVFRSPQFILSFAHLLKANRKGLIPTTDRSLSLHVPTLGEKLVNRFRMSPDKDKKMPKEVKYYSRRETSVFASMCLALFKELCTDELF